MKKVHPYIECIEIKQFSNDAQPAPTVVPVKAWPYEPQTLVLSRRQTIGWWLYDAGLILLPVLLIVKVGLVIIAEKKDHNYTGDYAELASELSYQLVNFNDQLVTLFTIVFATIMATFVKRLALWKAQRGAYMTDLEQIQGSVSLPSTAKLVLTLRSFNLTSVMLLGTWCFYYIGSQAVKNEYRLTDSGYKHMQTLVLQQYNSTSLFDAQLRTRINVSSTGASSFTYNDTLDALNFDFQSILLDYQYTSSKSLAPSTSGGPLIPDPHELQQVKTYTTWKDRLLHLYQGWNDTTDRAQGTTEAGKYFINLADIPPALFTQNATNSTSNYVSLMGTYTVSNVSFFTTNCSDLTYQSHSAFKALGSNYNVSINASVIRSDAPRDKQGIPLREFDIWWQTTLPPYQSNYTNLCSSYPPDYLTELTTLRTTCNITAKYVDLESQCGAQGCFFSRMRWANGVDEADATRFDTPWSSDQFASTFFGNFINSTGPPSTSDSLATDATTSNMFLLAGQLGWGVSNGLWCNSGTFSFPANVLSQGINTYYTLSQMALATSLWTEPDYGAVKPKGWDKYWETIHATVASYERKYRIYWMYLPLDIISNLLLLMVAIAACWLRLQTVAPDIFGYVSSLTRDNPDMNLPVEGSTLDGISRARKLKYIKVKLGGIPVQGGDRSAERVGLAPMETRVQQLQRDYRYV